MEARVVGGAVGGFARWLFGLAAEQPLEYRHLLRIRHGIYTTVAMLDAEVIRSAEPIPFAEIDHAAFRPIETGAVFGTTLECAWLHVSGAVPAGIENPVILLGVRGESLIHTAQGEVVDTTSTVFLQGDLPHSGGVFRPIEHVDVSGERVEFYADVAYNGFLLYPYGRGVYHGARIAVRDEEVFALYYDYLALLVLAGATEDEELEAELRASLREAYAAFGDGDVGSARAALAERLAATSDSDFVYSAIGHGHLDMAWLWPLRETHRKAARTYTRALNTIQDREGYLYGTSQPQQLYWMKHEQPALYERVRAAVAADRIELQGRRFLQEEFGLSDEQLRLCWLPDTFGYNGNLPQILKKSGMDWFQTIKLAWNKVNDFPHRTFHWQGIDGSSVLVHMPPEGDYNSRAAADGLLRGIAQYPERELDTALLVYGSGDGGGGPGEVHLELLQREQNLRGLPRIQFSTARDFFECLETLDVPHTHVGELYLETHQGTYTSMGAIKRGNRNIERALHNAEALAAIVGDDSRSRLESPWREVLLNQFHDILPGSSIERVNREAVETYARLQASIDGYLGELTARLPRATGTPGPTAVNLTSFPRREHVKVADRWYRADVAPYAAAPLEPFEPLAGSPSELAFTEDTLSNGLLTLRFSRSSGEIVSCLDARGREHAGAGLNRLVLHRDPYQFPFDAWDIAQDYFTAPPRTLRVTRVESSRDGATITRRQLYRFRSFAIEQRVVLEAGSDVVRFETIADWHAIHRMLRAEFRPTHVGPTVRCEIQFGHLERVTTERDAVETAQFEVCAHKWVATHDDIAGFALLNDSKYGHRAKNGLLSLNLLRSPTFPDATADRGIHRFTYAFTPFAPGDLAKVVREGYRLNNPLLLADGAALESVARVDDPGVVIETIKAAENGRGLVVRLYESLGRPTTTALHVTMPHTSAQFTDLLERPSGAADLDHLAFGPFEIVTILLED
jgi:alpha-mannosidase